LSLRDFRYSDPRLPDYPTGLAPNVHHLRRALIVVFLRTCESPRWLEAQGRTAEAEALMQKIEKEAAAGGTLPAPAATAPTPQLTAASMFRAPILQRLLVGSWVPITINTLIFGFVIFLPQFFLR
jgi:putative MFS transporter